MDGTFLTGVEVYDVEHGDTKIHRMASKLQEAQEKLENVKRDYTRRVRAVKKGEADLLAKQYETMEAIEKFKGYINDKEMKIKSMERRIAERLRLTGEKDAEIKVLEERLRRIDATNAILEESLDNIKAYPDYLDKVARASGRADRDELIAMYRLLKRTNDDLKERSASAEQELIEKQRENTAFENARQNEILLKKGRMSRAREMIEELASSTTNSTGENEEKDQRVKRIIKAVSGVRDCIHTLHVQAQSSYPVPKEIESYDPPRPPKYSDRTQRERTDIFIEHIKKQVDKVRDRIDELREVVPLEYQEQTDAAFLLAAERNKARAARKKRGKKTKPSPARSRASASRGSAGAGSTKRSIGLKTAGKLISGAR